MKLKKIAKLFNTSNESFVNANLVSEEAGDDGVLIANIYYDSGVDRSVFSNLYLTTLKRFYSAKWSFSSDPELLKSIRLALRKRRNFYLPNGVKAELVHSLKDVWTFAVFITGLLLQSKNISYEKALKKLLDKKTIIWLQQKEVWEVLISLDETNGSGENSELLRSFYIEAHEVAKGCTTEVKKKTEDPIEEVKVLLTNKDIGVKCLDWLFRHAETEAKVAQFVGDKLLVRSPSAFIAFSKDSDFNWKSAQKGILKLRIHEPNEETGTPFHKADNQNVMVFLRTKKEH